MRVNLRVQKQTEKQIRDSRLAQLNSLGSSTVANAALTYQHDGDGGLGGWGEKNGFSFGLIFPISFHPKWSYYTICQCCHKAGNNCSLIDCFVNALCKVCWRKLHSSVELQSCESSGWKKEPLSHPPTPPPALLPPFAADLSGQPSPSLHSFSCSLWGRFFLHPPLTTRVTSELSYQTATHCCIFISKASWCFLAGM